MEGFENAIPVVEEPQVILPTAEETIEAEKDSINLSNIHGLSNEELKDVNKIKVTISDKRAPVIILFGPASCGKTMTLVRLSRYLKRQGYTLQPVRTFRPAADNNYKDLCDNFSTIVNSDDAASRTDNISFMLVQVIKNGKVICQILEGPGELYFNPTKAHQEFPTYVHYLFNDAELRKIFVFFVEPNFMDPENRSNYVSTLGQVQQSTDKQKHIFLYNKIDLTPFVISPGKVHLASAKHQVASDYPGIFANFKNLNPITSLWRPDNFEFVPFQTGTYTKPASGDLVYIQGSDRYPQMLGEKLQQCIKG